METPLYKKPRTEYRGAMELIGGPRPGQNTGASSAQRTRLSDLVQLGNGYPVTKMDKMNSTFQAWRYNNLGRFANTKTSAFNGNAGLINIDLIYGKYPFLNQNPFTSSGALRPPIFIHSLTRAPQTTNGVNLNSRAYTCVPVISDATNDVRFVVAGAGPTESAQTCPTLQAYNQLGTASSSFDALDSGVYNSGSFATGSNALLHSADITLQLYGQKNRPTRFRVMICQFDEDNSPIQDTLVTSTSPELAVGYPTKSDAGMFWVDWIKKLCFNPSHKGIKGRTCGMKVMFERYIYVDPVQNTDNDGSPQVCTYRLQPVFTRLLNYRWANPSAETINELWAQTSGFNVRQSDLQCDVEPKARIYLIVTADNYTQTTQTSPGPIAAGSDTIPSMEFDITTTWRVAA